MGITTFESTLIPGLGILPQDLSQMNTLVLWTLENSVQTSPAVTAGACFLIRFLFLVLMAALNQILIDGNFFLPFLR